MFAASFRACRIVWSLARLSPVVVCLIACLLVACPGCGSSDFGTVTGTVLAEGEPLPNAMVTFTPEPSGRPSSGLTNEQGVYTLRYTKDQAGALVGEHVVRISTAVAQGDYGNLSRERLPAKYNIGSEIKKEVKPGRNVIDLEVDFEGRVIQPGY